MIYYGILEYRQIVSFVTFLGERLTLFKMTGKYPCLYESAADGHCQGGLNNRPFEEDSTFGQGKSAIWNYHGEFFNWTHWW
jgi:hypothetical protein